MEKSRDDGKKVYEYVFNYFLNKIMSGELRLNDKIPPEREIVETLGVSRNSVREVMHMLEITGLIECVQGSGNYVRCDPEEYMFKSVNMVMSLLNIDYMEVFDIRIGYEEIALKLAMENAVPEDIERLHRIVVQMDVDMSLKESAKLDVEFHLCLVHASHNRLLILYYSMMDKLMDQFIQNMREKILMNRMRAELLRRSHWEIYTALVKKDWEAGHKALDKHFRIVGDQIDRLNKKKKEQ